MDNHTTFQWIIFIITLISAMIVSILSIWDGAGFFVINEISKGKRAIILLIIAVYLWLVIAAM